MKIIILLLTFILSTQLIANQKIYKWTDANGNVHYSEDKPVDTEVKEIKVNTGKSKPKAAEKQTPDEQVSEPKSADELAVDEYNKIEQERVAKLQNQENCKVAKKNLATLQKTVRVRKLDPKTGEYIRMDDTQRLNALKSAKKLISDVCK